MSSVRVLHGALCLQMVDEQRNSLQQMLLRKLREGGQTRRSLRNTSVVVQKAAKFGGGDSHLTSEDHDVLDGVRFQNRELVNCNDTERSCQPAGYGRQTGGFLEDSYRWVISNL